MMDWVRQRFTRAQAWSPSHWMPNGSRSDSPRHRPRHAPRPRFGGGQRTGQHRRRGLWRRVRSMELCVGRMAEANGTSEPSRAQHSGWTAPRSCLTATRSRTPAGGRRGRQDWNWCRRRQSRGRPRRLHPRVCGSSDILVLGVCATPAEAVCRDELGGWERGHGAGGWRVGLQNERDERTGQAACCSCSCSRDRCCRCSWIHE